MPKVLSLRGYIFFFYSNEGNEPMHIHVGKAEAVGKIWLEPEVRFKYMYGFSAKQRSEITLIVHEHQESIKNKWNEYFEK